ncbi:MAG: dockerin type I domain-containing protein, partial [Tepidisphaeraceae bacterium]
PSSANPTYINTNAFTAPGSKSGFTLASVTDLSSTYNTALYNQATGQNLQGGQNRVQFSVGEYPTEAVSVSGTPSPFAAAGSPGYGQGNPALNSATLLTALGTAGARQQFQPASILNESTSINNPNTDQPYTSGPWNTATTNNITSIPFAATAVTYSANPGTGLQRLDLGDTQWLQTTGRLQNGALFNVVARTVDTGQRVVFALNTGIDPSWAVGSNDDGNSTTSANATAQHSIGSSLRFDGKTSGSEAQLTISNSRMAVGALSLPEAEGAPSTAPVRVLSIDFNGQTDVNPADDSSNFVSPNFNSIISDGIDPINNIGGDPQDGQVVSRYKAVLISHYNSVKAPNQSALNAALTAEGITPATATAAQQQAAWDAINSFNPSNLSDPTAAGIKGDPTGDVAAVLSNVLNSLNTEAKLGSTGTGATDPADGLVATGYLLPSELDWTRQTDGGAITAAPVQVNSAANTAQSFAYQNYSSLFTTGGNFFDANSETSGDGATYGAEGTNGLTVNGTIPITAKDASGNILPDGTLAPAGNYLFGNFNQNGVRDYSAVQESVNAALSLAYVDVVENGGKDSMFTQDGGVKNSTVIPSISTTDPDPGWVQTNTDTKGDLIALGDYNGDGKFDGSDLYLFAIGASLADSTTSNTLTANYQTFSDAVRNPNAVLRKNAALNYINTDLNTYLSGSNAGDASAAAFLFKTARSVLTVATSTTPVPSGATDLGTKDPITGLEQFTYDPTGANAFNSADVNRDGVIDFNDAVAVDGFNGQSYTNLTQSLAATILTPVTGTPEPVSLAVVQQVDGESAISQTDLNVVNSQLTGTGNANWYGYNVDKTGPGTINWQRTGGTVTVYSGASFTIGGGTVQVGGTIDPFSDNSGNAATTGNHVALTVDGGATLQFTQTQLTSTVSSLTIDTTVHPSQVNLGSNTLAIDFTGADPAATIRGYLASGYNLDKWTGAGIVSSIAASNTGLYAVGYADGNVDKGTPAGPNQILIENTLAGDANLDGIVNFADLLSVAQNFNHTLDTHGDPIDWADGDFNYDGNVNFADLLLVAQNFNKTLTAGQLSQLPGSFAAAWDLAEADVEASHTNNVPEPTTVSLMAIGAAGLLARRRKRRNVKGN